MTLMCFKSYVRQYLPVVRKEVMRTRDSFAQNTSNVGVCLSVQQRDKSNMCIISIRSLPTGKNLFCFSLLSLHDYRIMSRFLLFRLSVGLLVGILYGSWSNQVYSWAQEQTCTISATGEEVCIPITSNIDNDSTGESIRRADRTTTTATTTMTTPLSPQILEPIKAQILAEQGCPAPILPPQEQYDSLLHNEWFEDKEEYDEVEEVDDDNESFDNEDEDFNDFESEDYDDLEENDYYAEISWGVDQLVEGFEASQTEEVIKKTRDYMMNRVFVEDQFASVRENCQLRHELCSFWAAVGACPT